MTRYKQSFTAMPDGVQLFTRSWMPETDPDTILLYVHGLGSHSGRMDHWAERFNAEGMGFIAYDQRGHGKTEGRRGAVKHLGLMVGDAGRMVEQLREMFPGARIVLYGHSLGGNIAINYVISETFTVDALITTSPWLRLVNPPPAALVKIVTPLARILPKLTLSNQLDAADISRVEEEVEKYRNDPLVHDRISVGLFKSAYEGGYHALNNVYKINCPFLIMHGTGDRITSHTASEKFVMNTSDRTRLKLWDGAYHELHHETIRDEVFKTIIDWLNETRPA